MSQEVWFEEGGTGIDGYVAEEFYEELKEEHRAALEMLFEVYKAWTDNPTVRQAIKAWLEYHTPKYSGETLDKAFQRIAREGL